MKVSEATVQKIKVAAFASVSTELAAEMKVEVLTNLFADIIGVKLTGWVLGQEVDSRTIITYDSWWEMLKMKFPWWLLRRLKRIQRTVHKIDVLIIYPHLHKKIALPKEDHFLTFRHLDLRPEDYDD